MPLLKPRKARPRVLPRAQSVLRCPVNGHQISWCRGLCTPIAGIGLCGRPAPHLLVGKTQAAILAFLGLPASAPSETR